MRKKVKTLEQDKVEIDAELGLLLRRLRAQLPQVPGLRRTLKEQTGQVARLQIEMMDLQARLARGYELSPEELEEVNQLNPEISSLAIDELFEVRRNLLGFEIADYQSLITSLEDSNQIARQTIVDVESQQDFFDRRLLWTKSTGLLSQNEIVSEWQGTRQLFTKENWERALTSARENWFPRFFSVAALLTLALFVVLRRPQLLAYYREVGEEALKRSCTSIRPTLLAVIYSVLRGLGWSSFLFAAAIIIDQPHSYRVGLINSGVFLAVGLFLYECSRSSGLFESHFDFSLKKLQRLRSALRIFVPLLLPFVFTVGALGLERGEGSAGRLAFMASLLIVMMLGHYLFWPKHSLVSKEGRSPMWLRAAYALTVILPLVFLVMAGLGYFSSALILRAQVLATAGVLLGAYLASCLFTRWILVSRRRLAIRQAMEQREALLVERKKNEKKEEIEDVPNLDEVKAHAVDVVEVETQSINLVRFCVYFAVFFAVISIWSSSFAAFSALDRIPVIPGKGQAEVGQASSIGSNSLSLLTGEGISGSGGSVVEDVSSAADSSFARGDFLSWQDVLLALIFFAITFVVARNVPGLLSLLVFSRIKLGPGGNYALTTIVRYAIVLIGCAIALGQLGISWDKVQWLAAAITLGIGFGLQEIFANFVAGLILLFERPIRLGDIVTVGDISGKVSQIRIRATTVQQFNGRDLVVPNREFITSQLTNWTLRDTVLRFELSVGIAYGSDTKKAEAILNRVLAEHPHVLKEPGPTVLFRSFGASTLDFLIWAHVGRVEHLSRTQSDLHFQIDEEFRAAEIEIAFPQQDIHIRSLPEGENPLRLLDEREGERVKKE